MKRTFRARPVQLAFAVAVMGLTAFACGDDPVDSGPKPDAGPGDGAAGDGGLANQPTKFSRANRGSVLDISEDDTILVAANRDVGTISVFDVAGPTLTKRVEVPVCAEPFQVSLTPNGERAFVVCREAQKVVRVDNLRTQPVKGPEVAVGSEPVGIALTPKATSAYVANWVDGTLMELDTETLAIKTTIDLNAPLVETGVLGTVAPRTALAHPRSVAITNNKDENENDESVFVTEYFSQTKEPLSADGRNADIARQGYVYRVSVKDKTVRAIPLPPFNDIGIQDHAGGVVGCHANQTQAVDVQGSFAYVLSICASPKGPLADYAPPFANCAADATCPGGAAGACDVGGGKCTTNCTQNADCGVNGGVCANNVCQTNSWDAKAFQTPAIHVIDIGANKVIAQVALNGEFDKLFAEAGLPDDSSRRFPLNIDDISFVPGTLIGYVAAKGSDAVYRVEFNATYETKAVDALGSPGKPFIPLDLGTIDAAKQGKLPTGLIVAHKAKLDAPERWAYVVNEATRNITSLDLTKDEIAGLPDAPAVVSSADMPSNPEDEAKLEGKRLFGTGLGRWSFKGQAWGSCESCHWEGLSDQETWFHLKGPRQSPSLDQTFDKKTGAIHQQNWGAVADEIEDHEGGALRGILGGVGAIVNNTALANSSRIGLGKYGGLNGSSHRAASTQATSSEIEGGPSVLDDWKFVGEYIKSIRIPHKPSNLDATAVAAGRGIFQEANCQGCHGGSHWTLGDRFYTPASDSTVNNALKSLSWKEAVESANFPASLLPTALEASQTMRYNGPNPAGLDSMTCLLRPVGTYNKAEAGVGIAEVRRDHVAVGQGNEATGAGFNVPSLVGAAVNAPFFHAGNARTLEALLSDTFAGHHASALSPNFLAASDPNAATKRAQLIQFLLSIDESTEAIPLPDLGPTGGNFCSAP